MIPVSCYGRLVVLDVNTTSDKGDHMRGFALIAAIALSSCQPALAKDADWTANAPEVREWFSGLKQPDNPRFSCCGEADAYYADSFEMACTGAGEARECMYVSIITDERDDAPLNRPHVRPGTKIIVPNAKLKFDAGNPTGHGVIFMNYDDESDSYGVYCYVAPGGG